MSNDTTLVAVPHYDTDGDESYTFEQSGGSADGPCTTTFAPGAVVASAQVTVQTMNGGDMDEGDMDGAQTTEEMTEMTTDGTPVGTSGGSGPGFTVILALLAVVAAAILAVRCQR